MAIRKRRAQLGSSPDDLINVQPPNVSMLPDIPAAGNGDAQLLSSQMPPAATPTVGLLTDAAPLTSTSSPVVAPTSTPITTPTATVTPPTTSSSAAATQPAAVSHGLSQGGLAAAIVVPIACLAILIPVLTLWFISYRRKAQDRKYASQRYSHSREPMIQRPISYRGSPPNRPQRSFSQRQSPTNDLQEPSPAQTRNSLGLFNFELSPTTPSDARRTPESQESTTSPRFRFSVARALELRRSQPNVVQPHAQTSDTRLQSPPRVYTNRPSTRDTHREGRRSIFDPPPPYASPRPSEAAQGASHFAPLSRIGTMHSADRSPPQAARRVFIEPDPDRSTYASSDAIRSNDTSGLTSTRSTLSSQNTHPLQGFEGMFTRKPVPLRVGRGRSQTASSYNASYLPERISDVSGFSLDTSTRWEDDPRHESNASSAVSPIDHDISTIHPYHPV